MAENPLDTQQRKEAQARYDSLTRRIAAVDRDIESETDGERSAALRVKRDGLARDREGAAAELTAHDKRTNGDLDTLIRNVNKLGPVLASDHPERAHEIITECANALTRLDNRVLGLEGRVTAIERHIHPPLTVNVLRAVAALVVLFGIVFAIIKYPVFVIDPILGITAEGALIILAAVVLLYANAIQERPA